MIESQSGNMADEVQYGYMERLGSLIDLFEAQLMELEVVQSIYSGDGEIEIIDTETVDSISTLCKKFHAYFDAGEESDERRNEGCIAFFKQIDFLKCVSLNIKLSMCDSNPETVNVCITLPLKYPKEAPEVFISSSGLTRDQQRIWNAAMHEYLEQTSNGEQIIYKMLQWLKDTGEKYFISGTYSPKNESVKGSREEEKDTHLGSMWLYMHHIYNKEKRKNIINWANELQLTGFSLPGKPGVVYVEGNIKNVDEYFVRLRRLSWKRMSCVCKESLPQGSEQAKAFHTFEELCFDAHGGRDYHMDMGKFHLFLKEHNLGHMFAILFGIKE